MPIHAPVGPGGPVEPELPDPLPPTLPPAAPFVTWTPPGGQTRILSDVGSAMLGGVGEPRAIIGLDMPPQEEGDTPLAMGGEMANFRRWAARPCVLPIVIHAATLEELGAERRALIRDFTPALGDGVFTIAYPDGSRRSLTARYSEGLNAPEHGRMGGGRYYDSYLVTMKARDPFAYGDELSINFDVGPGKDFYPLPFDISPSITTGDSVVTIDGEVEVWPVWELVGPMTTATLRNRDTGQTLELTPNLTQGQVLIVRTDPQTPPAEQFLRGTTNVWGQVATDFPVFWALRPGSNNVAVLASGTEESSRVTLRYRPRYLSV